MSTRRPIVVRPVAKPIKPMSSAERRSLELTQLETRYKSTYLIVKETEQETVIRLGIQPSDPDFPYALETLQLQLKVPKTYPDIGCELHVLNPDLPKLYAAHIEKGYRRNIKTVTGHTTLVRQMNWLDHHIVTLLQEMEDIVETRNKQCEALKSKYSINIIETNNKEQVGTLQLTTTTTTATATDAAVTISNFSQQNILGNDGKLYIKYHMPTLYPLEPCTIEIENEQFDRTNASCIIKAFDCQHENRDFFANLEWLNHHLNELIQQQQDVEEEEEVDDNNDQEEEEEDDDSQEEKVEDLTQIDSLEQNKNQLVNNITCIMLNRPRLEKISLFHCTLLNLIVKCNQCHDIVDTQLTTTTSTASATANQKEQQQQPHEIECPTCKQELKIKFQSDFVHQGTVSLGTLDLTGCSAYDILSSQFTGICGQCMADLNDQIMMAPHDPPYITHCHSCQAKMTVKLNDFQFMQINDDHHHDAVDNEERKEEEDDDDDDEEKENERKGGLMVLHLDPMTPMMLLGRKQQQKVDTEHEPEHEKKQEVEDDPLPKQGTCIHDKSKRWFRFNCCKKVYPCNMCHNSNEQHLSDMPTHYICGLCSKEDTMTQSGKPCTCGYLSRHVTEQGGGVRKIDPIHRKNQHKRKGLKKSTSKKHDKKK